MLENLKTFLKIVKRTLTCPKYQIKILDLILFNNLIFIFNIKYQIKIINLFLISSFFNLIYPH